MSGYMTRPRTMLLAISLTVIMCGVQASPQEPVWFWFKSCGGPAMTLEVRLDRRIIFKSSFPLCRADRSPVSGQGESKSLYFAFKPHRVIVWKGSRRDEGDPSPANQEIDGDIWLAGSDPDDLLPGVSFVSSKTIYMNSIHVARPMQRDETEMAPGLVVTTYPIKPGKRKIR